MAKPILQSDGQQAGPVPIEEMTLLWLSAGLSCHGETIASGGSRIVDMLVGDQLPRIC